LLFKEYWLKENILIILHCKTYKHAEVKNSLIQNAGLGLFAFDKTKQRNNQPVFEKGDIILPYDGQEISRNQLIVRYQEYTGPYCDEKE
jgi:endonuclease I